MNITTIFIPKVGSLFFILPIDMAPYFHPLEKSPCNVKAAMYKTPYFHPNRMEDRSFILLIEGSLFSPYRGVDVVPIIRIMAPPHFHPCVSKITNFLIKRII